MARPWSIAGEYLEACSCAYLCPCATSNAIAPATEDFCAFVMAYRIGRGRFDATDLADVTFAIVGRSKAVMADGGWTVGLIVDERATGEQTDALVAIASGRAGGPMAAMAPLIADFRGVERRPIRVEVSGSRRAVHVPGLLEQEIEGVPSVSVAGECLALDDTFHRSAT